MSFHILPKLDFHATKDRPACEVLIRLGLNMLYFNVSNLFIFSYIDIIYILICILCIPVIFIMSGR